MAQPKVAARFDDVQMMRPGPAFAEEMSPRDTLLSTVFVTDAPERHDALRGIRNVAHGDGNINNRFSGEAANGSTTDMLDGEDVCTYGSPYQLRLFGKQVMPPLSVRSEPHHPSF
jgi:hypothetical protein